MRKFASLLALLTVVLLNCVQISGQADEASNYVLLALNDLRELEGYHFTYESIEVVSYADKNEQTTVSYELISAEGDAVGDDNYATLSLAWGNTPETARTYPDSPSFQAERVVIDGQTFLNLRMEYPPPTKQPRIAPGWWNYTDLIKQFSFSTKQDVGKLLGTPLPSQLPINRSTIIDVHELEPEVVDDIQMRVFDVRLNALTLFLQRAHGTTNERLIGLMENARLLAASDLSASFQLWIGAENNYLYRLTGEEHEYFPYLAVGQDGDPAYNIDRDMTIELVITQHGEPVEISAPSPIHE